MTVSCKRLSPEDDSFDDQEQPAPFQGSIISRPFGTLTGCPWASHPTGDSGSEKSVHSD